MMWLRILWVGGIGAAYWAFMYFAFRDHSAPESDGSHWRDDFKKFSR